MTLCALLRSLLGRLRKKRPDSDVEQTLQEATDNYDNLFRRLAESEAIDMVKLRAGTTTNHAPRLEDGFLAGKE